jgi:hypothetical protein
VDVIEVVEAGVVEEVWLEHPAKIRPTATTIASKTRKILVMSCSSLI